MLLSSQVSLSEIDGVLTFPSDQQFLLTILEQLVFLLSPLSAIIIVSETVVQGLKVAWKSVEFSQQSWQRNPVFVGKYVQHLGQFSYWQVLVLECQLWCLWLGFTIGDADEVLDDWVDLHFLQWLWLIIMSNLWRYVNLNFSNFFLWFFIQSFVDNLLFDWFVAVNDEEFWILLRLKGY